jgi:hypothetical protein
MPRNIIFLSLLTLMLLASGCSKKTKSFFGLSKTTPDEFAVIQNQPLTVPPMFTLQNPNLAQDSTNSKSNNNIANKNAALSQEDAKFMKQVGGTVSKPTKKKG